MIVWLLRGAKHPGKFCFLTVPSCSRDVLTSTARALQPLRRKEVRGYALLCPSSTLSRVSTDLTSATRQTNPVQYLLKEDMGSDGCPPTHPRLFFAHHRSDWTDQAVVWFAL